MSDADINVETNANQPNANVQAAAKRGFAMPLFALSQMVMPGIPCGITEQSIERARENYEKMKTASGQVAEIFREAYTTNAKGAADYGAKVIEISGANTNSAFDFISSLMGTKSLSDIISLSATQSRKNFDAVSAQNKELWTLVQKIAIETAEPIRNSVTKALQKVA